MKKIVAIFAVIAMLCTFAVTSSALNVDIAELEGAKQEFGPHGYPDVDGYMFDITVGVKIGNYDLSKYDQIKITYATDGSFKAKTDDMKVTSFFAVAGGEITGGVGCFTESIKNEDKILAKVDCTDAVVVNPGGINWDKNERTAVIDISDVDNNGEVWLYHFNAAPGHQALVTAIKLIEADGDEVDVGDKDPAENPETGDFAVVAVAAVAALALAGVVVCKKVRA